MGTFFRSVCEAVRADGRGRACPENYGGSDVYGSFKNGNATFQAASGVVRQLPRGLVGQSAGTKKEEVTTKD